MKEIFFLKEIFMKEIFFEGDFFLKVVKKKHRNRYYARLQLLHIIAPHLMHIAYCSLGPATDACLGRGAKSHHGNSPE
jgi:hypothetical protein